MRKWIPEIHEASKVRGIRLSNGLMKNTAFECVFELDAMRKRLATEH